MSEAANIADAAERAVARDPSRSVIVQAPAGSGKTELLMQRYLALLSTVDEPEEILAVTFTRKAAAEMRSRILAALRPGDPDDRLPETALLADQVLARNAERQWQLFEYPARLRVRTFDSVNSWLRDAAPVSSGGVGGAVTEQVGELYELAARRALENIADKGALGEQLSLVLTHLDNQADRFIALMAQMLVRRDQWLPLLLSGALAEGGRAALEASLHELVARELSQVDALLSLPARIELTRLLPFAAAQNARLGQANPVAAWLDRDSFPLAAPEQIDMWRGLADFCLVKNEARLRKSVNKTSGFPTPAHGGDKDMTARAKALLDQWQDDHDLAASLHKVRRLPDPVYSDMQWEALDALIAVLPVVVAELYVVFAERGETDYTQIATEALQALGDPEEPTGLALRLDYQVRHILIDEFQDTSRAQFRLLQMLTEGWTGDDGRTLLVVGDPMQSIYRFRQAEVSLYMQLWRSGIGNLALTPVQLTTNFRSARPVVEWVNTTFTALMSEQSDPATGAVRFATGTPNNLSVADSGVHLHAFEDPPRLDEAHAIGQLVKSALEDSPTDTIGILVRTRNQARLIVPALRELGIGFSGAGLEKPGETSVEQDLIALTRALSHRGDRTAWLAMLRAPWCGLSLHDISALCGDDHRATVLEQMHDEELLARLSVDGRDRVSGLAKTLHEVFALRGKSALRDWVEGAWQRLGGPGALASERELTLAEQFFVTLEQFDTGGDIAEAFLLHEQLVAPAESQVDSDIRVHLLTLYKAKGLEYDIVMLPALDGTTRGDDKQVIAWHEFQGDNDQPHYLLAPVEAVGDDADPIQGLIRQFDNEQSGNERDRLLYVATTRARRKLHLFFGLKRDKDGELQAPRKGSLLERMWPAIDSAELGLSGAPGREEAREEWLQPMIKRLVSERLSPPAGLAEGVRQPDESTQEVTFDWAGSDAMRVGSVVHRCLQFIAEQQLSEWWNASIVQRMLQEEGVAIASVEAGVKKVRQALATTLNDEQGRWLLAAHASAECELPITVVDNGLVQKVIVDRTFIDKEDARWIIDYKTSPHEGGDIEGFLAEQKRRYADQLAAYKAALQSLEPERQIRTALYFTLQGVLSVYD